MSARLLILSAAAVFLAGCAEPPKYPVYERDVAARNVRFDACMAALPDGAGDGELEDAIYACHDVADKQTRTCIANCPSYEAGSTTEPAADGGTEPRGGGPRTDGGRESAAAPAPGAAPSTESNP